MDYEREFLFIHFRYFAEIVVDRNDTKPLSTCAHNEPAEYEWGACAPFFGQELMNGSNRS